GTGGAGSAVASALLSAGVRILHLVDADPDRAAERAAAMAGLLPGQQVAAATAETLPDLVRAADGLVNATPVGMHHHPGTPVAPGLLEARQWVADVVYLPLETELIAAARARGCEVLDGGHM